MESEPARVLIVDDEPEVCNVYRDFLTYDHDVITATTGQEALEKLDETIDVILLDRRMPGMSGDEVASRIRERNLDPKIVMVTAVDPDLDLLHLEFSEYLVKPVTEAEVKKVVDRMISHIELETELQGLLQLASKLSTLESKLSVDELEESGEYERLVAEFQNNKEQLKSSESEMDYYHEAIIWKLRGALSEISGST